jgi:GTP-dependent dephospho-CoA kinase
MRKKYSHGILGGTFDQFHIGHQKLIDTAFEQSEHVTIGVTRPVLYKHKLLSDQIDDYTIRKSAVITYLERKNLSKRATIIPIDDMYGDSLKQNMDAIFATYANLPNVRLINRKRRSLNLNPLRVVLVPTLKGDDGQIITSQRIRLGEIDRTGHSYKKIFKDKNVLILPDHLRDAMRHPLGKVSRDTASITKQLESCPLIIAVGDIVTLSLLQINLPAAISIIDGRTRRHTLTKDENDQLLHSSNNIQRFNNAPATIHTRVVDGFRKAIKTYLARHKNQILQIHGEEDLLALPAMLLAPLGSIVLYGQVDLGVVVNEITEEKKKEIERLLRKFR